MSHCWNMYRSSHRPETHNLFLLCTFERSGTVLFFVIIRSQVEQSEQKVLDQTDPKQLLKRESLTSSCMGPWLDEESCVWWGIIIRKTLQTQPDVTSLNRRERREVGVVFKHLSAKSFWKNNMSQSGGNVGQVCLFDSDVLFLVSLRFVCFCLHILDEAERTTDLDFFLSGRGKVLSGPRLDTSAVHAGTQV